MSPPVSMLIEALINSRVSSRLSNTTRKHINVHITYFFRASSSCYRVNRIFFGWTTSIDKTKAAYVAILRHKQIRHHDSMLVSNILFILALFSPLENYGTLQCSHLLFLIVLDNENHFYKYPKRTF